MTNQKEKVSHPGAARLADFIVGGMAKIDRERMEEHLSSCDQCLERMAAAHEAVTAFNNKNFWKKLKDTIMKKINIYLLLTVICFCLSFITPRYFIQLLAATLLLGMKWVADSKSTKMLVMIYEAWKKDGSRGAADTLKTLEKNHSNRIDGI